MQRFANELLLSRDSFSGVGDCALERDRSEKPTHSTKKPGQDNRGLVGQYPRRFVIEVSYK
ncbi:MAG: hypothetical protein KME46_29040 [Brasilonema angustatum HA4187-MV1]|nr:hypothetical protein [Brasilonema angustatum HA4187-MV1]